jgi:tripartite-type tricarboxylate transporter receptor subunit TctC
MKRGSRMADRGWRSAGSATLLAAAILLPADAAAQSYPERPLRLVVTSPPGGANDIQSRIIGQRLAERLGQPVVIDNRGGASGMLAAEIVVKAPADGYTVLGGTNSTFAVNPTLFPRVQYDTLRDFAPVSVTVMTPHILLVHPALPARSVKDLVAAAKAQPGQLNYASSGAGSAFHLGMELLKTIAGVSIVHVPFKGSALSVNAMLAGDVQMMLIGMTTGLPLAKSGRARVLAVANPKRSALAPDLPTIAESGVPGFGYESWFGLMAPARTPRAAITRLHQELAAVLGQAEVRERLAAQGYEIISTTPAGMAATIREDTKKWAKVIKDSGARAE